MDSWSNWFATTGAELDVQDALVALERVLGRRELPRPLRSRLEEAAAALRQVENATSGSSLFAESSTDLSR